jgi:hypothetical protein
MMIFDADSVKRNIAVHGRLGRYLGGRGVAVACVSERLCRRFDTGSIAHPNAVKPLHSTQQIRRNSNIC